METNSKARLLRLSLRRLFGVNKPNITRLHRKDDYYRDYYFNKQLSEGIEFIAKIERISKKQAAELLMKAGFSSWMGEKVGEYIQAERAARERNESVRRNRFVRQLILFAREHGMDISKFF